MYLLERLVCNKHFGNSSPDSQQEREKCLKFLNIYCIPYLPGRRLAVVRVIVRTVTKILSANGSRAVPSADI